MSNVTRIALSAAIILGTAFSALTAANAGFTREQAASSGTGIAAYSADGGIVSSSAALAAWNDRAARLAALFVRGDRTRARNLKMTRENQ